ncbi:MAG: hypothetical protein H0U74_18200, partial [Bradymonadaceae bacterium]|nr:hypothetical protein [Lujinxingiaceae bacterium]
NTNNTNNTTTGNNDNNTTGNNDNNTTGTGECKPDFGQADACGGNVVGTWSLEDACSQVDLEGLLKQACPLATVESMEITTSGTLVVTAAHYARNVTAVINAVVLIPNLCAQVAGGCQGIEAAVAARLQNATATCTPNNDGCSCDLELVEDGEEAGAYTLVDGVITVADGSTFYYCVEGANLSLREFGTNDDASQPTQFYGK